MCQKHYLEPQLIITVCEAFEMPNRFYKRPVSVCVCVCVRVRVCVIEWWACKVVRSVSKLHSWAHTWRLASHLSLCLKHINTHTHTRSDFSAAVSMCETVLTFGLMSFAVVTVNLDLRLAEAINRWAGTAQEWLPLSVEVIRKTSQGTSSPQRTLGVPQALLQVRRVWNTSFSRHRGASLVWLLNHLYWLYST